MKRKYRNLPSKQGDGSGWMLLLSAINVRGGKGVLGSGRTLVVGVDRFIVTSLFDDSKLLCHDLLKGFNSDRRSPNQDPHIELLTKLSWSAWRTSTC